MELTDAVYRRRMIRAYDPDRPVPRATIADVLAHAVRAPSAGHTQGWHFVVLDHPDDRAAFWAATTDGEVDAWLTRMQAAPALILCFSNKDTYIERYAEPDKGWIDRDEARWPVPYWDIDTGMAAMIALLRITDVGLAACFFGVPPQAWPAVRASFTVPDEFRPVGVISLGYPAPDRRSPSLKRGRRALGDMVSWGRFGVAQES